MNVKQIQELIKHLEQDKYSLMEELEDIEKQIKHKISQIDIWIDDLNKIKEG